MIGFYSFCKLSFLPGCTENGFTFPVNPLPALLFLSLSIIFTNYILMVGYDGSFHNLEHEWRWLPLRLRLRSSFAQKFSNGYCIWRDGGRKARHGTAFPVRADFCCVYYCFPLYLNALRHGVNSTFFLLLTSASENKAAYWKYSCCQNRNGQLLCTALCPLILR